MAVDNIARGMAASALKKQGGGGGLTVTNTAAVGQTVKITAVDENGQPTEWEAVDMASGGNGGWEVIADITLDEDGGGAAMLEINQTEDGHQLEYRELMVSIYGTVLSDVASVDSFNIKPFPQSNCSGYLPASSISVRRTFTPDSAMTMFYHYQLFRNHAYEQQDIISNNMFYNGVLIKGDYKIKSVKMYCSYKNASGDAVSVCCPFKAGGRIAFYGR